MDEYPTLCKQPMNSAALSRLDALACALADGADTAGLLELPWLRSQVLADAAAGRYSLWARSTIVDENVGGPVLGREVFEALHELAGQHHAWPIGNAGLLHVYGYLLSVTPTPYGLKRERWLDPALASAYGLADDAFSPWTPGATLLERATGAATSLLRSPAAMRIERDGRFIAALSATTGPAAVAYARVDPAGTAVGTTHPTTTGESIRLITTFPVSDATAVLDSIDADPGRLRWNAVD